MPSPLCPTAADLQASSLRHAIVQARPGEGGHIQQPGVALRLAASTGASVQQQLAVGHLLQQRACARWRRRPAHLLLPTAHHRGAAAAAATQRGDLQQEKVTEVDIIALLRCHASAKHDHKALARGSGCGALASAGQRSLNCRLQPSGFGLAGGWGRVGKADQPQME